MTQQLRQQLKILINTFIEQRNDIELCIDKIIELFQENDEIDPATIERHGRRRSSSIFGGVLTPPSASTLERRRSSTYNEQGLVNNTNTVLFNNRDID
jgi:hypothetical protein